MNTNKTHTLFLLWFLLTSLTGFGLYMTWDKGLFQWVILTDNTRICVVIVIAFVVGSGLAGWRSIYLSGQFQYFEQFKRGHRSFKPGQSICNDYLTYCGKSPHESQLMAEVMAERARGTHQVGWFVTGLMIKLGLLGTVVGFIMMLSSLEGLEQLDISDIKTLMQQMTQGMGVAMNTTLVGLVGSILLGLQFLLLDRHADRLIADTVDFAHRSVKAA
ncbi:MAG: MotA/TolQ/ExbB proton channel family protein [Limnobacter sp.]|uniref:MotA/TolQ/ExbB proton channel family protein n=1 Tax=Limnobacter sp. TaxID=2003368 RepID=UPI0022C00DBE|nr:MotA/TolQ/ExbB proton channel family protein [Limnobacter sp.]MCZ8014198.1 MotA/TolQ/ExbB proton channel family protein [Limnobacter sp.]